MGEGFAEHHEVARGQGHFHREFVVQVDAMRQRIVGLVRTGNAAEPSLARRVIADRPLHGDESGVDAAAVERVVLRGVERCAAAVQAQPGSAGGHHDAVRVVEAHGRAAQFAGHVEHGVVVDEIAQQAARLDEPREALRHDAVARWWKVECIDLDV